MIRPIIMPKLGETMEEGKIVLWKKKEGDKVTKGEILLEISTDKANFEVESPGDGILLKIVVPASDDPVPVIKKIGYIGDSPDEKIPEKTTRQEKTVPKPAETDRDPSKEQTKQVQTEPEKGIRISPLAKKLAKEKGIDITKIEGTGPGGRITEKDISNYQQAGVPVTSTKWKEVALTGIKKIVAERLSKSKKEIPHYYLQAEVDMTECMILRKTFVEENTDIKVTYNDIIVKAAGLALREHSMMNAHFVNNKIRLFDEVNVGIAVALDDGLIVPVVKNTDKKSIIEIAKERSVLVQKVKEKKATPDDISGGTFTVSNLGMYDVDTFTAIINPPEVALLAIGKIKESAVAVEGKVAVKNTMRITLSGDHRVVDGVQGAKFLARIKEVLEKPQQLL